MVEGVITSTYVNRISCVYIYVVIVFVEMAKLNDTILNVKSKLKKWEYVYGFEAKELKIIKRYLYTKTQTINVQHSLLQGGILFPILFVLFKQTFHSEIHAYAHEICMTYI